MTDMFNISRIGNIGAAFGLFQRSLNGERITADDIPAGMHEDILKMAMDNVGATNLDEFFENEQVIGMVRSGLRADTLGDKPAADKILPTLILGMEDKDLRGILKSNPQLLNTIIDEIPEEQVKAITVKQVEESLKTATMGDVLKQSGASEAVIASLPASFTAEKLSDLDAGDVLGSGQNVDSAFTNEQLATLVSLLPAEQFQSDVLDKFNAHLGESQKMTVPADASFDDKLALFNAGIARVDETINNSGFMKRTLNKLSGGTEGNVFNEIRAAIPDAIETFKAKASDASEIAKTIDLSKMDLSKLDIDQTFPAGELKKLVEDNKDAITAALTKEENWPMIEAAINADLLKKNKDRIMEEMLPKMTEQGLNSFNAMMDGLPPQFKQMINMVVGFFAQIFGPIGKALGLDNMTSTPATRSNPETPDRKSVV